MTEEIINTTEDEIIALPVQSTTDLNDRAIARLLFIANRCLTPHQKSMLPLLAKGASQTDIGRELNICQATVNKLIKGAQVYFAPNQFVRAGGLMGTIAKHCQQDEHYRLLIAELESHEPTPSMYRLTSSWFEQSIDFLDWLDSPIHKTYHIPIWQVDLIQQESAKHRPNRGCSTTIGQARIFANLHSKTLNINKKLIIRIWHDATYSAYHKKKPRKPSNRKGNHDAKLKIIKA